MEAFQQRVAGGFIDQRARQNHHLFTGKTIADNSLSLLSHQRIIHILHRLFHSKKTAV
ncbi:MAG: hypothetical protein ACK49J_01215 [Verrucomicrobiota bacterium]